jgi:hypothetical protein
MAKSNGRRHGLQHFSKVLGGLECRIEAAYNNNNTQHNTHNNMYNYGLLA